jgi:Rrf2 family protein
MRLGEGVEWGLHSCTVLALLPPGMSLPAARLAELHGVPPAYLAKHLQALARAGVIRSEPGARGGYSLARPAHEITLLEVVLALEGEEAAFRCTEIRQRGPAPQPAELAALKPCGIARAMWRAEDAWRQALRDQTIADVVAGLAADVDPTTAAKAAAWFQEVLR